ncbi:MAG TPA: protein kinase, partial [Gemmatimonadales bacterium]|nr:protein kinase [Gemmatimonadales bacterium]
MTAEPSSLAASLKDRYRLDRELGQGGMATVYLAHDLRHNRPVALKVLRPEIAAMIGGERFLNEIRTTANLQHPHILALFDSGTAGDHLFYVMPYVEGETLRQRLEREKQLPIPDAVRIAGDVASALDYAHRRGVLHRDIKPENILLHEGRALVADFGIALAMRNAGGTRLTETGLTLGTPQYMSPEQASAERDLGPESDIYALGAVLYEMLTGTPPFTGTSAQAIVAQLMTEAPRRPAAVRRTIPPALESAVLTALEKVPADRWRSAADFARGLDAGLRADPAGAAGRDVLTRRSWLTAVFGVVALAALAFAWRSRGPRSGAVHASTTRATIPLGQDLLLAQVGIPFDISADGTEIVYAADSAGQTQLYLRPIGSFDRRALPGTIGATHPFLSPDGRWIGFFDGDKLEKIARDGSAPVVLADSLGQAEGGNWGPDGTILFAVAGARLYLISERGGRPTPVPLRPDSTATELPGSTRPAAVRWPSFLPDGRHALVTVNRGIGVVTLATGALHVLMPGSKARYLSTGHLIYDETEGRIRVIPFDVDHLAVTGEPVPAFEAFRGPGSGAAQFAVSQTGTLVYVAGGFNRSLVLTDRNGRETPVALPARGYRFPRFSPDGQRLSLTIDPRPSSIWVADLARSQLALAYSGSHAIDAIWSPDGQRLAFTQGQGVRWVPWQGGEPPQPFLAGSGADITGLFPRAWTADGRILAQWARRSDRDIMSLTPGDTMPRVVLATPASESQPSLSPDGRWMAFRSNLSGADEIYARAYPVGSANLLVSSHGGT